MMQSFFEKMAGLHIRRLRLDWTVCKTFMDVTLQITKQKKLKKWLSDEI